MIQGSHSSNVQSTGPFTAASPGVDGAVGVSIPNWYVAIVAPRHEKAVADKLRKLNIDCYVAIQKEIHLWANGRRKVIDRVVIPSIVFIRCTDATRREIVKQSYIHRFMVNRAAAGTLNKPVAIIPALQMQKLMFILGQSDLPVNFTPTLFKVNDNVRVIRGPLIGLEGHITRKSDGTHALSVALSILGGAVIIIDPNDVEILPNSINK